MKDLSNTRKHPKTPLRLAKSNVFYSKGYFNRYIERMEDKSNAITNDGQKSRVNRNKNRYDHHIGVINYGVNMVKNIAEKYYDEGNM